MGAWDFLKDLLPEIAREAGCSDPRVRYAGRETSAAPATGLVDHHRREQDQLIDEALELRVEPTGRLAQRKKASRRRSQSGARTRTRKGS